MQMCSVCVRFCCICHICGDVEMFKCSNVGQKERRPADATVHCPSTKGKREQRPSGVIVHFPGTNCSTYEAALFECDCLGQRSASVIIQSEQLEPHSKRNVCERLRYQWMG